MRKLCFAYRLSYSLKSPNGIFPTATSKKLSGNVVSSKPDIFIFAFGGYELPFLLGATVPKALPVQAYLAYTAPNLRDRPYAMAMNAVILLLCFGMSLLYGALMRKMMKRTGGWEG